MEASKYHGKTGIIRIDGDALTLTYTGKLTSFKTGEVRRIPLQAISDVRLKEATAFVNGWITLGLGGAQAPVLKTSEITAHPDTVVFPDYSQMQFKRLFDRLRSVVETNRANGVDPSSFAFDRATPKSQASAQYVDQVDRAVAQRSVAFIGTIHVGSKLSDKARSAIVRQSVGGDQPWLILVSSGGAGLLTAWDDRLAIIKTGGWTGLMAGALGGERSATFHYTDITAIEYNSGLMNGVLEVMTPSYQGTANKDFWRGGENNPYTVSNTLPLAKTEYQQALPQISELRRRIGEAKRPVIHVQQTHPQPANNLADQLKNLAELYAAGVLSEDEFTAAKARLLG